MVEDGHHAKSAVVVALGEDGYASCACAAEILIVRRACRAARSTNEAARVPPRARACVSTNGARLAVTRKTIVTISRRTVLPADGADAAISSSAVVVAKSLIEHLCC